MASTAKPDFWSPWGFTWSDAPYPRWWKKRFRLKSHFVALLDETSGLPHQAETRLWDHGVSSNQIAEFFCLVARYGRDQVFDAHFTPDFD